MKSQHAQKVRQERAVKKKAKKKWKKNVEKGLSGVLRGNRVTTHGSIVCPYGRIQYTRSAYYNAVHSSPWVPLIAPKPKPARTPLAAGNDYYDLSLPFIYLCFPPIRLAIDEPCLHFPDDDYRRRGNWRVCSKG